MLNHPALISTAEFSVNLHLNYVFREGALSCLCDMQTECLFLLSILSWCSKPAFVKWRCSFFIERDFPRLILLLVLERKKQNGTGEFKSGTFLEVLYGNIFWKPNLTSFGCLLNSFSSFQDTVLDLLHGKEVLLHNSLVCIHNLENEYLQLL